MSELLVKKENFCYMAKLNRPDKHNAFNPEMIKQLTDFFASVAKDKFAGTIVLSGAGPSFCAGGDLEWMRSSVDLTIEENQKDAQLLYEMYEAAQQCPLPIIGFLHGNVFGGGVGLAAICDIAIAEASTKFCFSEVKLGLIPAVISSFVMNKMVSNIAQQLMITGKIFNAELAHSGGLIEFVGRELEAKDYLRETILQISKAGPEASRAIKELLLYQRTAKSADIKKASIKAIADRRVSEEGQEGIKSFLEKRKPAWLWAMPEESEE